MNERVSDERLAELRYWLMKQPDTKATRDLESARCELQQAREDLKVAREYMAHHGGCAEYHGATGDCTCGLSAFLFKLDSEGL